MSGHRASDEFFALTGLARQLHPQLRKDVPTIGIAANEKCDAGLLEVRHSPGRDVTRANPFFAVRYGFSDARSLSVEVERSPCRMPGERLDSA